jgi:hypothetical protein
LSLVRKQQVQQSFPLFLSRERHIQEKVAGGENFVVGVLRSDTSTPGERDTAAAKCTGFLSGEAARRLLQSPA